MEQGRFRKGFLVGMACTLVIGGGGLKIYDVVQSNVRNQGAVTDSFVQKAKYIEDTVKESYTGRYLKEMLDRDQQWAADRAAKKNK